MLKIVFAVRASAQWSPRIPDLVERLVRFYAPLGADAASAGTVEVGDGVVVGWISDGPPPATDQRRLTWGEEPPGSDLREYAGSGMAIEWSDRRVRIVTGAAPPVSLYVAERPAAIAWATHAVAAAWLAGGSVSLRAPALAELAALEFVTSPGTLVDGVEAVPVATCIDVRESVSRTYWPVASRWEAVPEAEASAVAEERLLASLDARVRSSVGPALGLTGGLDSRVAAVALRLLGCEVPTFTWGHNPADAGPAASWAASLGLQHSVCAPEWLEDEPGLDRLRTGMRWTDGTGLGNPFGVVTWPSDMTTFVTGGAGEVGRAFYYRYEAANYDSPSADQLVGILRIRRRLQGAPARVAEAVTDRVSAVLADLQAATGARGWRLLDVFYAEQRVFAWGRGITGRPPGPVVAAFAAPATMAALSSLPLADRVTDGFHRQFLSRHGPAGGDLPPAPVPQRAGIPRPLRRAVAAARRTWRDSRYQPWPYRHEWLSHPLAQEWMLDAVLGGRLVRDALGESYANRLRSGLLNGSGPETHTALLLAGPVALQEALGDLR